MSIIKLKPLLQFNMDGQPHQDAYDTVADYINDTYIDVDEDIWIISIRTGTLGEDVILYDKYHGTFIDDWYEGGFVEVYSAIPLNYIINKHYNQWNDYVYDILIEQEKEFRRMNKHMNRKQLRENGYLRFMGEVSVVTGCNTFN